MSAIPSLVTGPRCPSHNSGRSDEIADLPEHGTGEWSRPSDLNDDLLPTKPEVRRDPSE